MSEPDDNALDEYLRRDSAVSRQYRRAGGHDVPAELDRRVLAQARAALEVSPPFSMRKRRRWSTPLALAASVALAVMAVIEIGTREQTVLKPEDIQTEIIAADSGNAGGAPAAAPPITAESSTKPERQIAGSAEAGRMPAANAARVGAVASQAEAKTRADAVAESVASQSFAAPPPAPSVQALANTASRAEPALSAPKEKKLAAQLSVPAPEVRLDDESEDKQEMPAGSPPSPPLAAANPAVVSLSEAAKSSISMQRAAAPQAPVSRPAPTADEQRLRSDPKRWLGHIQELRKRGEIIKAEEELKQFKAAWPKYPIDEDIAKPASQN